MGRRPKLWRVNPPSGALTRRIKDYTFHKHSAPARPSLGITIHHQTTNRARQRGSAPHSYFIQRTHSHKPSYPRYPSSSPGYFPTETHYHTNHIIHKANHSCIRSNTHQTNIKRMTNGVDTCTCHVMYGFTNLSGSHD